MRKSQYKRRKRKVYKRPKKRFYQKKFFWIIILFFSLLGASIYFFIFSSLFQVKEVEVLGADNSLALQINSFILDNFHPKILSFPVKSIFLFSEKKVTDEINKNFPIIGSLKIKKYYPNTIKIEFKKRRPVALFCVKECFFLDKNGIIYAKIQDGYNLVSIFPVQKENFHLGERVIPPLRLSKIFKIKDYFNKEFKISIKSFSFQKYSWVKAKTMDGWEIFFDLNKDIDTQLQSIGILFQNEIPKEKIKDLEYIDLRFDKIFYKYRISKNDK